MVCVVARQQGRAKTISSDAQDIDAETGDPLPPILYRVEGLTKIYGAGVSAVQALRGVDLEIRSGELIVLLGPSGSGKSTILNILGGLDEPTAGHVWFEGQDLTALDGSALTEYRRQHVGFVFQFYNLVASL